jgi:hypothetical protein
MKRAILAVLCCAVLLANAGGAAADAVSDQDMASRYLQAAKSGDDEAQFYLGALYSAGVGVPMKRLTAGSRAPPTRAMRMPC